MTNLAHFDPWGLVRDLDRLFVDGARNGVGNAPWLPRVDVFEKDASLVVRAEVPGIDAAEIDVTFERGTLTITGSRGFQKDEELEGGYHRKEIFEGRLQEDGPPSRWNGRRCDHGRQQGRDPRDHRAQEGGGAAPQGHRRRPAVTPLPPTPLNAGPLSPGERAGPPLGPPHQEARPHLESCRSAEEDT